jgi:hypothetical protein
MSKSEFLRGLRDALSSSVPESVAQENLSYYDSYIEDEKKKGRTEEEILTELGDPRLIAKSIEDAGGYEDDSYAEESSGGNAAGGGNEDGAENHAGRHHFGWSGSGFWVWLIPLLVVLLLIFLVVFIVLGIFRLLYPVLLPLLIIFFVFWLFGRDR